MRTTVDVDPTTPLLYVLSDDLQLRGPKFGCGLGQCGACTVIVGGQADPVVRHAGLVGARREITTLEGLGTVERPHPIQQAFIDEQAAQCGFCLNGVILTAKAFLDRSPQASEAELKQALWTACSAAVSRTCACSGRSSAIRRGRPRIRRSAIDLAARFPPRRRRARRLVFAAGLGRVSRPLRARPAGRGASRVDPRQLDSWIAIASDGSVTALHRQV